MSSNTLACRFARTPWCSNISIQLSVGFNWCFDVGWLSDDHCLMADQMDANDVIKCVDVNNVDSAGKL